MTPKQRIALSTRQSAEHAAMLLAWVQQSRRRSGVDDLAERRESVGRQRTDGEFDGQRGLFSLGINVD